MSKELALCPHPGCRAQIPVPRHLVDGGLKLCSCLCHSAQLLPMRDDEGNVVLRRVIQLGGRALRKGDRVLIAHTYQTVHGGQLGTWYSIASVGRGGKSPRDDRGTPLDVGKVVGVIEEVAE